MTPEQVEQVFLAGLTEGQAVQRDVVLQTLQASVVGRQRVLEDVTKDLRWSGVIQ